MTNTTAMRRNTGPERRLAWTTFGEVEGKQAAPAPRRLTIFGNEARDG